MANTQVLRELLEVQKQQLACLRALVGAHDAVARSRAFLSKWGEDFAGLPRACRDALPPLEKSYGKLLADLADNLGQQGPEALENDFELQDFLDKFGMRLSQLGTLLNVVAPFAEIKLPAENQ